MAKRIMDIADELGISAKAIIQKCLNEGVPPVKVQGPLSTVSAGLEAAIREWAAGTSGGGRPTGDDPDPDLTDT